MKTAATPERPRVGPAAEQEERAEEDPSSDADEPRGEPEASARRCEEGDRGDFELALVGRGVHERAERSDDERDPERVAKERFGGAQTTAEVGERHGGSREREEEPRRERTDAREMEGRDRGDDDVHRQDGRSRGRVDLPGEREDRQVRRRAAVPHGRVQRGGEEERGGDERDVLERHQVNASPLATVAPFPGSASRSAGKRTTSPKSPTITTAKPK